MNTVRFHVYEVHGIGKSVDKVGEGVGLGQGSRSCCLVPQTVSLGRQQSSGDFGGGVCTPLQMYS